MSSLLQIVKGLSMQPKCVLVLGARTEAMLNWSFSLTATQVVLVEPEPAMFEKATLLHDAKGSPESVVIKHGVPAFDAKQKSMRYFVSNVLGYSSVFPPSVIKSIRPALEFTEQDAAVIELQPLLQQFDISESRPCLLISQLNGAEQQCLNNQILKAFTHVVIQSSLKPIFGESKPVEKLKKELTECGRDYFALDESMPPYSNFVATKKVNAEQALDYFSQRQQHREIKAELENQLNTSQSDVKKITEELQQAKEQLQTAQQREEKYKELAEEKLQLYSELEELKERSRELSESREQHKHWHHENKKWAESLKSQNEELRLELAEKNSMVRLGQKMLSKAQVDLDHLRDAYAEKIEAERELVELVKELREKLTLASKYYFKLQQEHPELITSSAENQAQGN